ncbi:sigma-70 family RNA polymerase sigma factor, partial [Candidatus Poribacteria bacterium]|nr:sigma-70 family RNA polymerase sigma factor [Candidatus Poribacteria bacterium]
AEEIAQDTFLRAYKKLSSLRNPEYVDGWLYVITVRVCNNWFRQNKNRNQTMQSSDDMSMEEIEEAYYRQHEAQKSERESTANRRKIVKRLLAKLPENERTVMQLYYFGGMTTKDISKFLGVSQNTIKSRIHRARTRLKSEEDLLDTEFISSIQLSTDLTDSIMKRIADIEPTPPTAKPILPWAAFGTAALVILLLLGAMNQYFTHFQNPYDFEALSEPTIDIVESPIHIDTVSIPTLQRRIGNGDTNSQNQGVGTTISNEDLASNLQDNDFDALVTPWMPVNGPQTSSQARIFTASDNIYAISRTSIYKLTEDGTSWMNINANVPINMYRSPLAEHRDVIYSVNTDEIYASTDAGETWKRFCSRPEGDAVGLIILGDTQENFSMFLALKDEGVFRSDDAGKEWVALNNRFTGETITVVASVGRDLFIGTNRNLHRLKSGQWNEIPLDPLKTVHSMAVYENNLYVVTGPDFLSVKSFNVGSPDEMSRKIFHSADSGSSWNEITPEDESFIKRPLYTGPTEISAGNKTLFVLSIPVFQSKDGGETWTNLGFDMNLFPSDYSSILATNAYTFYKVGTSGMLRTIDGGETWQPFTDGMVKSNVLDMVAFNNSLYVYTGNGFFKSDDNGSSWEDVHIDYGEFTPKIVEDNPQIANYFTNSKLISTNNTLYAIIPQQKELRIFRLRDDEVLSLIHRIPSSELWVNAEDLDHKDLLVLERQPKASSFAVSGNTFYAEYRCKLLKWTDGSLDTVDTGLTDLSLKIDNMYGRGAKLAASATTVYMGKRDGKLFQSTDSGNSWQDITPNIPYRFTNIKDMLFVDSTIYIATDMGVLTSHTGEHWLMLTDNIGTQIIIDMLATNGSNLFGAGEMGTYNLEPNGRWKQIVDNIPDKVVSLSANTDELYIGTEKRGIFHVSLKDDSSDDTITTTLRTIR